MDTTGKDYPSWISTAAFARSDNSGKTYAYAHETGELRLTSDGGITWRNPDPSNAVPNRYVTELAFDPIDKNTLYTALSGFDEGTKNQAGHLFKTTNAFAATPQWKNISPPANLPNDCIAIDPSDPKSIWVGTDRGLWQSADGGISWAHHGPELGMPNVPVFDIQINPETQRLVAFTHGRGAFAFVAAMTANLTTTQISDPPIVPPGCDQSFTLSLIVHNNGPLTATAVTLLDDLPVGFDILSTTTTQGQCALLEKRVVCDLGTLRPYDSAIVKLRVRPTAAGLIANVLTASAREADAIPGNRVSTAQIGTSFFVQSPRDRDVPLGGKITQTVVGTGCRPLTYQWNLNQNPLTGATNASLALTNAQMVNEGDYTVTVTDGLSTMTSNPGRISVLIAPKFVVRPLSQTITSGEEAVFNVAVSGNPPPFLFQLRRAGVPVTNVFVHNTNCIFVLSNVRTNQAGTYTVGVSNRATSSFIFSSPATLNVLPSPPTPPKLYAALESGAITLSLHGQIGVRYQIEEATDLLDWRSANLIVSPTTADGVVKFLAPSPPNNWTTRFYRAVTQ